MEMLAFPGRSVRAFALAAAFLIPATQVEAALITTTTGAVTEIAPPGSVAPGSLESNTEIQIFAESSLSLLVDQSVNHTGPGAVASTAATNPGVIGAGTNVVTYFIHFDKVGASSTLVRQTGSVTFDMNILGLDIFDANLDNGDGPFGAAGTTYTTTGLRGLELTGQDNFSISGDERTLNLNLGTSTAVDQIRVFVQSGPALVPEPSTYLMLGAGLLGLSLLRRRRD